MRHACLILARVTHHAVRVAKEIAHVAHVEELVKNERDRSTVLQTAAQFAQLQRRESVALLTAIIPVKEKAGVA